MAELIGILFCLGISVTFFYSLSFYKRKPFLLDICIALLLTLINFTIERLQPTNIDEPHALMRSLIYLWILFANFIGYFLFGISEAVAEYEKEKRFSVRILKPIAFQICRTIFIIVLAIVFVRIF